jgi:ubiquinone/menaquinone biosynthesis C-methylase UbiE
MDRKEHWENTYDARGSRELSWFQENPEFSLDMIHKSGVGFDDPIIDVGGGSSVLADCLLKEGYKDLTVLDISAAALDRNRRSLGADASRIEWIEQDITQFTADRTYALWHDRAMFHFLTREKDRKAYIQTLCKTLRPAGQLVIAAFAIDGPTKCSGLDIMQYDAAGLAIELGTGFSLLEQRQETHRTPAGRSQQFGYFRFRMAQSGHTALP